jgi:hypothetical protein
MSTLGINKSWILTHSYEVRLLNNQPPSDSLLQYNLLHNLIFLFLMGYRKCINLQSGIIPSYAKIIIF